MQTTTECQHAQQCQQRTNNAPLVTLAPHSFSGRVPVALRILTDLPHDLNPGNTQRTLYSSRFLQLYDSMVKKPHLQAEAFEEIWHALRRIDDGRIACVFSSLVPPKCRKDPKKLLEAAIKLWTVSTGSKNSSPHALLNNALIADDKIKLESWMGLVRLLTYHITCSANEIRQDLLTWRGSHLTPQQIASLREGEVIRPPMFVASSMHEQQTKGFKKKTGILVKIYVPAGCRNACSIEALSRFPKQKEVLLPPYTPLHVQSVSTDLIEVKVLNGLRYMRESEAPTRTYARAFPI
jgi:hypothetical protein